MAQDHIIHANGLGLDDGIEAIATAAEDFAGHDAVMDGGTVFGKTGLPDFRHSAETRETLVAASDVQAFDLLLSGRLRSPARALIERKRVLLELIGDAAGTIAYVDYLDLEEERRSTFTRARWAWRNRSRNAKTRPTDRAAGNLDKDEMHEARRLSDRRVRRKARRAPAQDCLALSRTLGGRSPRLCRQGQTGYTVNGGLREVRERLNP